MLSDLVRGIIKANIAAKAFSLVVISRDSIHGPEDVAFAQEFDKFLNVDHVLGVALATNALEIALRAAF